jgi:Transposase DDE domain
MEKPITDTDVVVGLKHFKRLMPLLHRLDEVGCARDTAGNRRLRMSDYSALVMLYLFNPMINSLRTLQQTVGLPHVARALGVRRFSLGSFSESPRIFEPGQLKAIAQELAGELTPLGRDPRLSQLKHALTLVDSTVLQGLCRLANAACPDTRYNTSRDGQAMHGWRLHTQLDLATFCPRKIERTGARNAGENREHNVLRRSLEAGLCYVGDGGYADRALFEDVVTAGSSHVIRMRQDTVLSVVEERLLSQEALDANIVRDAVVRLGGVDAPRMNHAVRLIVVQVQPHPRRTRKTQPGSNKSNRLTDVLMIVTNLVDLPAELIALIYQYRYSVELFFRFFKQLLGMRHLLSQRREGVDIQVYCCVIACMLINLQTGSKPNKLMVSMIGWYLLGVAGEQDVIDFLNKPDNTGIKKRAQNEIWKKLGV